MHNWVEIKTPKSNHDRVLTDEVVDKFEVSKCEVPDFSNREEKKIDTRDSPQKLQLISTNTKDQAITHKRTKELFVNIKNKLDHATP